MSKILNSNRRAYPSPLGPMVVTAVLVERVEGLCVYCAIVRDEYPSSWTQIEENAWVHLHGNKVPYGEAKSHFPGIPENRYAFPLKERT